MRRFVLGALLVLVATICNSSPQSAPQEGATTEKKSAPIEISDPRQVMQHRLSEPEPLRVANRRPQDLFGGIAIKVVVDEHGNVVSARIANEMRGQADNFYKVFYPAALAQAKGWKYKPFEQNGKPVSVTFTDYIRILPPEDLPKEHTAFPKIKDLQSLRIILDRTVCYGVCPSYRVEISGDGSVVYQGRNFVVLTGEHHDHISKEALGQIIEAFRKADYFSLKDQYSYGVTDNPTTTTSIAFDGQQKSVTDYVGEQAGMPHAVSELEETIDRESGTLKWVYGNAETVPSLLREKWDFKSAEAGLTLVRAACDRYHPAYADDPTVVRDLIAAGVPPDARDSRAASALECVAVKKDRETLILLMEAGAAKGHPELKNEALAGAARAGDLELVHLLMKYGADPNATWRDQTILMNAAMSGAPEVVAEILKHHPDLNARGSDQKTALFFVNEARYFSQTGDEAETQEKERGEVVAMLLKAGADPHLADKDGNTPLHRASVVSVAEALIKNGADVNARNNRGETPLMATYSGEIANLLIKSGADISARDNEGHTALDRARSTGFQDKVQLLQAAQNQTPGKADQ